MNKIKVLNEHLTNMIAAGEVVERPAGIIKELVENSIDAQAKHIEIRVKQGGMELIEVSDDGEGMSKDDLRHAFERHSTSKIHETEDLNAIKTFGFRGEALPSIASVTRVVASSHQGDEGHVIDIDNGVILDFKRIARNQGTTLSVKHLFLKTPARLKHIKNTAYESSIITDIVQKFAVANPKIAFTLHIDDKLTFRTYGRNDVSDVFHRVYGSHVSRDLIEFEGSNYDFIIQGIMALPQHTRSNRYAIWIYINNRMIRLSKAQKAIADAYRRHIPHDRYPIVVLNIITDPQLVDVNVHPSKWEIRLSKEEVLIELILNTLESALESKMRPQKIVLKPKEVVEQQDFKSWLIDSETVSDEKILFTEKTKFDEVDIHIPTLKVVENEIEPPVFDNVTVASEIEPPELNHERIEPLIVLSQLSGKYILAQGDLGLYIIDQHAAMERVRYEYFQSKILDKAVSVQDLLFPILFEGRGNLVSRLDEINVVLKDFQMSLDQMDDSTFVLRSVPLWIKENELDEFMNTILDMFLDNRTIRMESMRQNVIATLACHSSVRFNEYMSMDAMVELVDQLRKCTQPFHCPHGRPTFITVEHDQLLKEFKR